MLKRLLLVAYFIEVGLLLVLVPWSPFWERNYFLTAFPALHEIHVELGRERRVRHDALVTRRDPLGVHRVGHRVEQIDDREHAAQSRRSPRAL